MFKRENLDQLRERIDLVEVISGHIDLKRSGAVYKALCPFHQEKNPSFLVQKGDRHYHCFGCGAHGDAIQFLMNYLNLSFVEAVESLAEKFHVFLEHEQKTEVGIHKSSLKEACQFAAQFFHATLLYTEEGKEALHYLYQRGITLDFIRRFEIGFAPESALFWKVMREEHFDQETLRETGLIAEGGRPFFRDRITFPIRSPTGGVIGFSARKYREESFGGKYINTPETPLFKKSRSLFGLNYCRRRIVKERRAIVVEGQIDCLKLIEAGLNLSVAALGTAFGESHVDELKKLGVRSIYLLFDGDDAGKNAASKVGDILQKKGIEVFVVTLPSGNDPDSYLMKYGTYRLLETMNQAVSYLTFQVSYLGQELHLDSPAGKAELIKTMKKQIDQWEDPVMIHESLRKIASLVKVPEEMMGIKHELPSRVEKRHSLHFQNVDPNRILEIDLLRWLILTPVEGSFLATARTYLTKRHFLTPSCQTLFHHLIHEEGTDLLSLASLIEDQTLIDEILQKKINRERAEVHFLETVQKLLDRDWMQNREAIKMEIHSGQHSDEKVLELAKAFDALKCERIVAKLTTQI